MSFIDKVVWSEGMFLQPQHFQQQDRHVEDLMFQYSRLSSAYHWGISHLEIDEKLLALGKIAIISCRGIFPDGTVFDIPHRDKAPLPIDISEGTTDKKIYLALPLRRAGVAEIGSTSIQANYCRYQVETLEVADSNEGFDLSTPIQIGKLSIRLMLESDDKQGFSCLSLMRISEARIDKQVLLDNQFIPPCLNIQAVSYLASFLQELQGLLNYRGDMLVQRLTEAGVGGVAEIADFMLLQIINRFEPLFIHLIKQQGIHPEQLFRVFIQLMGELSTFTSRARRPAEIPCYLHDSLQGSFEPIMAELRRELSMVLEESAVALKLEQQLSGSWTAELADKSLLQKSLFVLAVHANVPPESIRQLFPAQVKIAPVEEIRNLVNRALPGIDVYPLSVAPRQIPYHSNYIYFALNREHNYWQLLEKSAAIAFHVAGNFPGLKLELWAVKDK